MLDNIIRFAVSIAAAMAAILLSMAILDAIWLGGIAGDWYQAQLAGLSRETFIVWPWFLFYLLYGGVTFVLAVVANRDQSMLYAGIDGGLLGLAAYGTYNLTSYSILAGYPLTLALVDWAWGVALTSVSAMAGWYAFQATRKD